MLLLVLHFCFTIPFISAHRLVFLSFPFFLAFAPYHDTQKPNFFFLSFSLSYILVIDLGLAQIFEERLGAPGLLVLWGCTLNSFLSDRSPFLPHASKILFFAKLIFYFLISLSISPSLSLACLLVHVGFRLCGVFPPNFNLNNLSLQNFSSFSRFFFQRQEQIQPQTVNAFLIMDFLLISSAKRRETEFT